MAPGALAQSVTWRNWRGKHPLKAHLARAVRFAVVLVHGREIPPQIVVRHRDMAAAVMDAQAVLVHARGLRAIEQHRGALESTHSLIALAWEAFSVIHGHLGARMGPPRARCMAPEVEGNLPAE